MNRTVLLAAAAVLALSVFDTASAAGRRPLAASLHHAKVHSNLSRAGTIWKNPTDDSGTGVVSQNFEAAYDAFDAQAADDFKIPTGEIWKITEIDVTGVYFNCTTCGPAVSENVTFYENSGSRNLPGVVIKSLTGVVGVDSGGSFAIKLPSAVKLGKGHYWVSVQVNMDIGTSGEWAWENAHSPKRSPAAWKNPGDGLATECTTYVVEEICIPSGQGPSHMFVLKGSKI
jgi:hypothetical protein